MLCTHIALTPLAKKWEYWAVPGKPMNSMKPSTINYHSGQGIAWITLDRPTAQNRVNLRMATEVRDVCRVIMEDDDVLVVVVTGTGHDFCAGDENEAPAFDGEKPVESVTSYLEPRRAAGFLAGIEKPVIAAINGDTIGHGLEMALACDIRLAATDARMGMSQITQGTLPWDGGTQRLPRIIGRAWATDLLLTGRLIDAQEALRIGLVHEVTSQGQLMERAGQVAGTIAALGPVATRYAKESVFKGMDMTLDQGMRLEMDLNLLLQTTADRAEGISSFLERRQPNFTGG